MKKLLLLSLLALLAFGTSSAVFNLTIHVCGHCGVADGCCAEPGVCLPSQYSTDPDCGHACTANSQCPSGSQCISGTCTDCTQNGVCIPSCSNDPDCNNCPACSTCPASNPNCCSGVNCPTGQACINGQCSDCTANGVCNPNCDGKDPDCSCTSSATCPQNSTCIAGSCTSCGKDNWCNPFCPAGTDPDCTNQAGGCVPACPAGFSCLNGNCLSCAADGVCNPSCAPGTDPDCCATSSDCAGGKICSAGTCVLPSCIADGFCNTSCANDPDCCIADGTCPTQGCARGSDPDCAGAGGNDTCKQCGADGMCNACCASDPDCGKPECTDSAQCGAAQTCMNHYCVYTPLAQPGGNNGNATFIIIYAPGNASPGEMVRVNVTFLNGTPATKALIYVKYPDGSQVQVITDLLGIASFNATASGYYYYDAYGVAIYQNSVTYVPQEGKAQPVDQVYFTQIAPARQQKTLIVPITITEPSKLTLSVYEERNQSAPSSLAIKTPALKILSTATDNAGKYAENYSQDFGRYVFTITAKQDVQRLYAKFNLERLPAGVEAKSDYLLPLILFLIALAIGVAYAMRKSLPLALSFGKGITVTVSPEKPKPQSEVEIVLELGKGVPYAERDFIVVLKSTNEMFSLKTNKNGVALFVPYNTGKYAVDVPGYTLRGNREFEVA